jgi:hypothetical protein
MSRARLRKKLSKVWQTFDDEWESGKEAEKNGRVYRMWDKSYDYQREGTHAPVKHVWCKQCAPSHPRTVSFFRRNSLGQIERLRNGVWS